MVPCELESGARRLTLFCLRPQIRQLTVALRWSILLAEKIGGDYGPEIWSGVRIVHAE